MWARFTNLETFVLFCQRNLSYIFFWPVKYSLLTTNILFYFISFLLLEILISNIKYVLFGNLKLFCCCFFSSKIQEPSFIYFFVWKMQITYYHFYIYFFVVVLEKLMLNVPFGNLNCFCSDPTEFIKESCITKLVIFCNNSVSKTFAQCCVVHHTGYGVLCINTVSITLFGINTRCCHKHYLHMSLLGLFIKAITLHALSVIQNSKLNSWAILHSPYWFYYLLYPGIM